jgi:hypothetical protein
MPDSLTSKLFEMSTEKIRSDRLGNIGEGRFRELCELAGLNVSKPSPDMTGKDFHVEFPFLEPNGSHTLDTRPAALEFYAQVKTIVSPKTRVVLSLSVAERLARDPKPTFIVVVRLAAGSKHGSIPEYSDISLIHVYNDVLAAILKRLRQAHVAGNAELHKQNISFKLNSANFVGINPQAIRSRVEELIGRSMIEYANLKHRQVTELGYGLSRFELKLHFDAVRPSEFVDGLLGLRDLPTLRVEHFERRFGISLPVDDHSIFERSKIKIEPHPVAKCFITLTGQTSGQAAHLSGHLYYPGQLAIDVGVKKLLVKSSLINIVIDEEGLNIKLQGGQNKQSYPLDIFMNSYKLIELLSREPCHLNIKIDGSPDIFIPIDAPINGGDIAFFKAILPVLEAAAQLRLRANAPDTPVHIEQVVRQRSEIMEANEALFERGVSISFETELPKTDVTLAPAESLFTAGFAIDCSYYAYAVRARVEPTTKADRVIWLASDVTPLVIEPLSGDIRQDYERFKERMIAISGIKTIVAQSVRLDHEARPSGQNPQR